MLTHSAVIFASSGISCKQLRALTFGSIEDGEMLSFVSVVVITHNIIVLKKLFQYELRLIVSEVIELL